MNVDFESTGKGINRSSQTRRNTKKWLQLALFAICFGQLLWFLQLQDYTNPLYGPSTLATQWQYDYSKLDGLQELMTRSNEITDFCRPGTKKECTCKDPMIGTDRPGQRHWATTARANVDDAKGASRDVDVVFIGDSISEGWKGMSMGYEVGKKRKNFEVYKSLFTSDGGGKYQGLVLGIAGDTSTNLLWRMQNGELPPSLQPAVFWLLIGTNDMGNHLCSPETALLGIFRVVEELRTKKPGSVIVLNGLLPRTFDRNGYLMKSARKKPILWNDIVSINKELEAYSNEHDGIEYFDAGDIFLLNDDENPQNLQIDGNLMPDFLHPSGLGYKLWGDKIVDKLDKLIKQ